MNRYEPIVEYAHIIGKSTADFTASDMSKFTKWWIKQPMRKDLILMKITGKKKTVVDARKPVVKSSTKPIATPVAKPSVKPTGRSGVKSGAKPETRAVTKTTIREAGKTATIQKATIPPAPQKASGQTAKGGFDSFQKRREEWRKSQAVVQPVNEIVEDLIDGVDEIEVDDVEGLPVPTDVDQIDESLVQYEDNEEEQAEVDEDEVEGDDEEEDIEVEDDPDAQEEQDEQEEQEDNGEQEVAKMRLTQLDVDALEFLLINAIEMMEIPEEHMESLKGLLEALTVTE